MRNPVITEIEDAIRPLEGVAGHCLRYAHFTAEVLHRHGLRPVIQAGSLQWPRVSRGEDDGIMATHFSYMWNESSPLNVANLMMQALPEIHVWVGLVETQEVIDFSVRNLREAAGEAGLEWTAADPPRYIWATQDNLPDWVVYTPHATASLLACKLLWNLYKPAYLSK